MNKHNSKLPVAVLGIDLAKSSFQLHGVDANGNTVLRKSLSRSKLAPFIANMPPCIIGVEACSGANYWSRVFRRCGHAVHMMAPQFVKPYVKSNKNDAADAEAICEAVQRPSMRYVPEKSIEQQDIQSLHRIRSLAVARRTAQANQIRGLLSEYGVIIPKGLGHVRASLPTLIEDASNELSPVCRELMAELYEELVHLDERIERLEVRLKQVCKNSEQCQRLMTIPGVGVLSATALFSAVGDIRVFKSGRELSAWLGLVPRQHSTGGKQTLLGISKRGDKYLRTLLIHGARSIVRTASNHDDKRSQWIVNTDKRRGKNVAAVAVANKNVRVAWALLTKQTSYKVEAA